VVRAGFESEFYLMKQSTGPKKWEGVDTTPYCSSAGFNASSAILSEVSSALLALGIDIEQMHSESGGGQFEIAMSHVPCLTAADNLLFIREAVVAIANKHLLHATFLPKYNAAAAGSGSHVHLSIWQGASNVFMARGPGSKYGMSKLGQEFLAGVLHHLPAILAFTAPNPNSYARIQPNTWSGAYQCWGRDNREAPLRTASPPGVDSDLVSNFELKSFDGCANPHLGLAAIIAAGIDGLQKHLQLPEPVDVNPSVLEAGKVSRLPSTLGQAVKALEADKVLWEHLGTPLVTAICAIRKVGAANDFFFSIQVGLVVGKMTHYRKCIILLVS
jgi:glutamine synthetase